MTSYYDIKDRLNEIKNDLNVVLSHDEAKRLWRLHIDIKDQFSKESSVILREKNEVLAINKASKVGIPTKNDHYERDWYGNSTISTSYYHLSPVFLHLLRNQANSHIAKRLRFLKGLTYRRAAIETELYAYLHQNLRLYGHPITKTTKAAIRYVIDERKPDLPIP